MTMVLTMYTRVAVIVLPYTLYCLYGDGLNNVSDGDCYRIYDDGVNRVYDGFV